MSYLMEGDRQVNVHIQLWIWIESNKNPKMGKPSKLGVGEGVLMPESSQPDKGRVLPGSRNSMSKDTDVREGVKYSENCKKLSMDRDRGKKGAGGKVRSAEPRGWIWLDHGSPC